MVFGVPLGFAVASSLQLANLNVVDVVDVVDNSRRKFCFALLCFWATVATANDWGATIS